MSAVIPATLIAGDGIGPEIVDATLAALDALGAPFEWEREVAGLAGVQQARDPLPAATLDSIRRTRLALKGPLETPSGGGYRSSNVRLLAHLPIILPGPARFRVGNTTRFWEMGKAWVFDDTIEHEAWNDADEMRVILIFDVWNPYLDDKEKMLITEMMKAQRDFQTA